MSILNRTSKEKFIWSAIGLLFIIVILAIVWFNHILTMPIPKATNIDYKEFLIQYYTNQNNWLNFGLYIITIFLAVISIAFALDYKTKKEEIEKFVNEKISNADLKFDNINRIICKKIDYSKWIDYALGASPFNLNAHDDGAFVIQGLKGLNVYDVDSKNNEILICSFPDGQVQPIYVYKNQKLKFTYTGRNSSFCDFKFYFSKDNCKID